MFIDLMNVTFLFSLENKIKPDKFHFFEKFSFLIYFSNFFLKVYFRTKMINPMTNSNSYCFEERREEESRLEKKKKKKKRDTLHIFIKARKG